MFTIFLSASGTRKINKEMSYFTGVKPNVKYYFYYNLYSVGSSKVGYVVSQAYPK